MHFLSHIPHLILHIHAPQDPPVQSNHHLLFAPLFGGEQSRSKNKNPAVCFKIALILPLSRFCFGGRNVRYVAQYLGVTFGSSEPCYLWLETQFSPC